MSWRNLLELRKYLTKSTPNNWKNLAIRTVTHILIPHSGCCRCFWKLLSDLKGRCTWLPSECPAAENCIHKNATHKKLIYQQKIPTKSIYVNKKHISSSIVRFIKSILNSLISNFFQKFLWLHISCSLLFIYFEALFHSNISLVHFFWYHWVAPAPREEFLVPAASQWRFPIQKRHCWPSQ